MRRKRLVALAHHIMLRAGDDRVITRSVAERRHVARSILRIGGAFMLLAFGVADNHVHMEAACDEDEAVEFGRRVEISLTKGLRLPVGFSPVHAKPIFDQGHLSATLHYCLRQQARHLAQIDPLFDATNLPDLLGWRVVGDYTKANMHTLLPRIEQGRLLRHLGDLDIAGAGMHLEDLADATAAAFGLPHLECKTPSTVAARAAAIIAAAPLGRSKVVGEALGLTPRTVRRLRHQPVTIDAVRAVRGQLRLRGALRVAHASEPSFQTGRN